MDFTSKIQVTCFAASYAVGMAAEVLRIFWPAKWPRWAATVATLAGLFAQTLFLLGIALPQARLPIASQFESLMTVSWLISLFYLYLLLRDRRLAAGIFLLPISLGLILWGGLVTQRSGPDIEAGNRVIAVSHGLLLLIGTVAVLFALVAALMYLVKTRQLRTGTVLGAVRLPSLERLDRLNSIAVYLAWPALTVGIVLGFCLKSLPLGDPKVIWTSAAWFVFTVLTHYRYHPENRGRKVALMTIVACVVVLVSVLGDPIFGTGHQMSAGGPQ